MLATVLSTPVVIEMAGEIAAKMLKSLDSIVANVRRYISVADYEALNYQNSNNINTRENDTRNTKTAIKYRCC